MTDSLKHTVAIVTGASRGIGKAIALSLANAGVRVVGVARSEASLQSVHQEIESIGGELYPIAADLALPDSPGKIVDRTINRCGRLDILVNNAGIALNRTLQETSCKEWDLMMNVNARAPFLLCRAAIPYLKQSDRGSIVQIASVVGVKGYVDQGAYSASKHALMGMTKVLAQEVQTDNIRVHTILPGGVATEMISSVRPDLDPTHLMQPKEIAEIVMFLLTHHGNAIIDSIAVRRAASAPLL
jgi:3-oxoacyl-[acyl-carrier protein] reductase